MSKQLLNKMVGVERFELPTHCSQSSCATRLRYTPKPVNLSMLRTPLFCVNPFPSFWATKNPINSKGHPCMDGLEINGAPGEIRTPDRPVRSRVLYPAELRARCFDTVTLLHPTQVRDLARGANYPREPLDCQPFDVLFYTIDRIHFYMRRMHTTLNPVYSINRIDFPS